MKKGIILTNFEANCNWRKSQFNGMLWVRNYPLISTRQWLPLCIPSQDDMEVFDPIDKELIGPGWNLATFYMLHLEGPFVVAQERISNCHFSLNWKKFAAAYVHSVNISVKVSYISWIRVEQLAHVNSGNKCDFDSGTLKLTRGEAVFASWSWDKYNFHVSLEYIRSILSN